MELYYICSWFVIINGQTFIRLNSLIIWDHFRLLGKEVE